MTPPPHQSVWFAIKNSVYGRHRLSQPVRIVASLLWNPTFLTVNLLYVWVWNTKKKKKPVTFHGSRVVCLMSHVMCHVSHVTCHMSHVTCIFLMKLVDYQLGLPRLYFLKKDKKLRPIVHNQQLQLLWHTKGHCNSMTDPARRAGSVKSIVLILYEIQW